MNDTLYTGSEAREKLMAGIKKIADAVSVTMGTGGSNSIIEMLESPGHAVTNDGYFIANSIVLSDPLEEMGRKILLEAINKANKQSGDGSSTTSTLTAAILEEGMKHFGKASPMEIKRSLEACIPIIEASIRTHKKNVTVDDLAAVASISAESEEIGNRIQEIYQKIGKEGIISWDISKTTDDHYTIGTGLTVNGATYVSKLMCDIDAQGFTNEVRMEKPLILLVRKKITSAKEFNTISQQLFNEGVTELAVFCEDVEAQVINDLIETRRQQNFRCVVIKMPVIFADEWWEDLSLAIGATVITGSGLRNATMNQCGTVEYLRVTKDDTYVDGIKDLTVHVANLVVEGSDASLNRTARLNTRTARYFVGAHSPNALFHRWHKVEDAINAASMALEGGVVAGGGVALRDVATSLNPKKGIGETILYEALRSPFYTIKRNAGLQENDTIFTEGSGLDTRTGKDVNMVESGIVDPADVVLNAVKAAIGVAASILTVGTVVLKKKEEK